MLEHDQSFEGNPYSPRVRNHWRQFLESIRDLFADGEQPTCFISYTWPPAGQARDRLHQRLTSLKRDLEALGATVYLDITNLSSNINAYMDRIDECDYVLLIGTPRLKARVAESDGNNMKYEYERIKQKLVLTPECLLPLMLEGDFRTAFPDDIGQILFRDFRLSNQGWAQGREIYLHSMADFSPVGLIPALYKLSDNPAKHNAYQKRHQHLFETLQQLQQEHVGDCQQWYQKANASAGDGDYIKAFPDYQQAANRLHAPACYRVAFFYNANDQDLPGERPVPQDPEQAFVWFLRGAQFGHVKSMIQAAERLAYRGRAQQRMDDFDEALRWATLAMKQAEGKDQRQAGITLEKVQRLRAEFLAKEQQDPQAMSEFAEHLLNNTGGIVPPRDDEAKQIQLNEALRLANAARQGGFQEADILIPQIEETLAQLVPGQEQEGSQQRFQLQ